MNPFGPVATTAKVRHETPAIPSCLVPEMARPGDPDFTSKHHDSSPSIRRPPDVIMD